MIVLRAYWDGGIMAPGDTYNPDHVSLTLWYDGFHKKLLLPKECQFDSFLIEKTGMNWYTVIYEENQCVYTAKFCIYAEDAIEYKDKKLKVLYGEKDLTSTFDKWFYMEGFQYYISWNQFLRAVNTEKLPTGTYYIIAPKNTGVYVKYASEWEVTVSNPKTIKATLKTIFNEEKNNDKKSEGTST